MKIGGLHKFSMIDYPGMLCAIVFTQGCNFRCPYCHNPELVSFDKFGPTIPEQEILEFLKTRIGKLDAVSITGGEPTLHEALPAFIRKVKELGFLVKLDTNGTNPDMLKMLIEENLVDYLAMDIKAPLDEYKRVIRTEVDIAAVRESINTIENSSCEYEFRTTLISTLHTKEDVQKIAKSLGKAKRYFLQKFVPTKTLDEKFLSETTFSDAVFDQILPSIRDEIELVEVR